MEIARKILIILSIVVAVYVIVFVVYSITRDIFITFCISIPFTFMSVLKVKSICKS